MNLFDDAIKNSVVILDFGSQYTQLIARRLRELGVYSEILPFNTPLKSLKEKDPKAIVLSGGPHSVYGEDSPVRDVKELLEMAPVLGVCYGMQLLCHQLGGKVTKSDLREYGRNKISWSKDSLVSSKVEKVWMSHGDVVEKIPEGAKLLATSESNHPAVIKSERYLAFQFHPEVVHTENGKDLLSYFVFDFCRIEKNWDPSQIYNRIESKLAEALNEKDTVLCALSGGVDSAVVAVLLTKILGRDKVKCIFVDTGLLRKNEFNQVMKSMTDLGLDIKGVDSSALFYERLAGVSDPEKKRKIIGHSFIDVFKDEIKKIGDVKWLAQGTLYPDVIESVSPNGKSVTIKSHHNVGGLPENLNLNLLEPVRELFKDEVRELGKFLKMPKEVLSRHPFPGPGLAIRVLGAVDQDSVKTLQDADDIFIEALKEKELYHNIWQAFSVLLPVRTVGVQGDNRTYEKVLTLRAVTSIDGMTADWYEFEPEFLKYVSNKITNQVPGVNRVVYDITSKPPGTIEWE